MRMSILKNIFKNIVRRNQYKVISITNLCPICNCDLLLDKNKVLSDDLISDWGLDEYEVEQFNMREGESCKKCGASLRIRNIAHAILIAYGMGKTVTLKQLVSQELFGLSIAEINYCSQIHDLLAVSNNLYYSEFGSHENGIRDEDLMSLSYKDSMLDLIINTDVLEHVPDIDIALSEISRTLKSDGVFIFTVPIIFNRKTKRRAFKNINNEIEFIESKSFHGNYQSKSLDYLVFNEFGYDFVDKLKSYFNVCIVKEKSDKHKLRVVFLCKKGG